MLCKQAHHGESLLKHPDTDFQDVAYEIITKYPEQSFCFLNESRLKIKALEICQSFLPCALFNSSRRVLYAMKANPKQRILEILRSAGIDGFDCASVNEIEKALPHCTPNRIYFNHPIKKQRDIQESYKKGVRHFTVQSRGEVEKVLRSLPSGFSPETLEIAVRVSSANDESIIKLSEKFGAEPIEAIRLVEHIREMIPRCQVGFSIHTGSQNLNPQSYETEIKRVASMAQGLQGVSSLNIGGGLPATRSVSTSHPPLSSYFDAINSSLVQHLPTALSRGQGQVMIELGRAFVADAIDLVIPVLSVERAHSVNRVYIDDGVFTSFSDSAVHDWKYPIQLLPRNQGVPLSSTRSPFIIFGRTCDSGDHLSTLKLPENIQEGDYIHVPCAGAYMDSQTSYFNGFDPPRYVSYNLV